MLRQVRPFDCALIFILFISCAFATDWICPAGNRFCYQRIPNQPRSWNESRADCARIGGDLPGADNLVRQLLLNQLKNLNYKFFDGQDELIQSSIHGSSSFWTNLCFSNGRLQWLEIRNSRNVPILICSLFKFLTLKQFVSESQTKRKIYNSLTLYYLT